MHCAKTVRIGWMRRYRQPKHLPRPPSDFALPAQLRKLREELRRGEENGEEIPETLKVTIATVQTQLAEERAEMKDIKFQEKERDLSSGKQVRENAPCGRRGEAWLEDCLVSVRRVASAGSMLWPPFYSSSLRFPDHWYIHTTSAVPALVYRRLQCRRPQTGRIRLALRLKCRPLQWTNAPQTRPRKSACNLPPSFSHKPHL